MRVVKKEYVLYTNYGYGWEEEFAAKTKEEVQSVEKNYHDNVPGIRTKIKVVRVCEG